MNSASSPTLVSRRDFVSRLALAGAALPLVGATSAAVAAEKKMAAAAPASTGPTTIHVFSKPMHMMSHAETAKLIAECGYGGIDYTVRKAQAHVSLQRLGELLKCACELEWYIVLLFIS